MCETGFVSSSKSLLSFRREMAQQEVWIPKLGGGGGGGG